MWIWTYQFFWNRWQVTCHNSKYLMGCQNPIEGAGLFRTSINLMHCCSRLLPTWPIRSASLSFQICHNIKQAMEGDTSCHIIYMMLIAHGRCGAQFVVVFQLNKLFFMPYLVTLDLLSLPNVNGMQRLYISFNRLFLYWLNNAVCSK